MQLVRQANKKWFTKRSKTHDDEDDEDDLAEGIGDVVKGYHFGLGHTFWLELTNLLRTTFPAVFLPSLMEGNQPCLGHVYFKMCVTEDSVAEWGRKLHKRRGRDAQRQVGRHASKDACCRVCRGPLHYGPRPQSGQLLPGWTVQHHEALRHIYDTVLE